ncbi:MAG TPA: protocatechuate 3,4-dioxygenase subunit beta [Burkholderiales bacterium]|nr:protocatechuate 3,4-dioxygenase subunit beta [Burkholderiales bacterium]
MPPFSLARRDPATQSEGTVAGYAQTFQRWPAQPLVRRPQTRAELTGPANLARRLGAVRGDLAGYGDRRAIGQLIKVRARIVDEDGVPVSGALVEVWHCNAAGKYLHPNDTHDAPADPNFYGAARMVAGDSGLVELRTIKPAAYPVPDTAGWWRPPHIHFSVWGRVWLSRLVTQMFFPGEPLNESDAILNAIRDPEARRRCIAELAPTTKGTQDALVYEYQIVVRGRGASPKL